MPALEDGSTMSTGSFVLWLLVFMASAWIALFGLFLLRVWNSRKMSPAWRDSRAMADEPPPPLERDTQAGRI